MDRKRRYESDNETSESETNSDNEVENESDPWIRLEAEALRRNFAEFNELLNTELYER